MICLWWFDLLFYLQWLQSTIPHSRCENSICRWTSQNLNRISQTIWTTGFPGKGPGKPKACLFLHCVWDHSRECHHWGWIVGWCPQEWCEVHYSHCGVHQGNSPPVMLDAFMIIRMCTFIYAIQLNDNSENLLYSASKPSQPFTAGEWPHSFSMYMYTDTDQKRFITIAEGRKSLPKPEKLTVPRASRNLAITLGVGLPLIIMVYVSALGAVIAQKELRTLKQGNLSTRYH